MAQHRSDDQPEPEKLPFEMSPGYWDLSELARLNMIQLKEALQQAALPAEEQIAKNRGYDVPFEVADDFDNWCRWVLNGADHPVLTAEQRASLLALDQQFEDMNIGLWDGDDVLYRPEWEEVRRKARLALHAFGWKAAE